MAKIHHILISYESKDPQCVNEFLNYNISGGKENVSNAFQLYSKAKSRMKDGGFN